jgi:elongation factor 1 alpha-like protein
MPFDKRRAAVLRSPPAELSIACCCTPVCCAERPYLSSPLLVHSAGKPLRMPISDVFKTKQGAVTVGGKLEGGALKPGTKVMLVPGYETATIKSLEVSGQPVQLARAGDSADVVLAGVDASNLAIGAVLCHPDYPVPVVRKVEMQVVVLDVAVPVLKGQPVTLHAHSTREAGHISALLALLNAKTGGRGGALLLCS